MNPDFSHSDWMKNWGTSRTLSTQLVAGWFFGFWVTCAHWRKDQTIKIHHEKASSDPEDGPNLTIKVG
jgi:hypothetical protein